MHFISAAAVHGQLRLGRASGGDRALPGGPPGTGCAAARHENRIGAGNPGGRGQPDSDGGVCRWPSGRGGAGRNLRGGAGAPRRGNAVRRWAVADRTDALALTGLQPLSGQPGNSHDYGPAWELVEYLVRDGEFDARTGEERDMDYKRTLSRKEHQGISDGGAVQCTVLSGQPLHDAGQSRPLRRRLIRAAFSAPRTWGERSFA